MKNKWNELSTREKAWLIITVVLLICSLVTFVLDITGSWKNQVYHYLIVVFLLGETVQNWNKSRKMAVLDLVVAVVILAERLFLH